MSEEQNVETTEETKPTVEETQQKTFTQEDVDRIVGERIKREREKYADYDDLKAKANDNDDLKAKANANDKTKSELEQLRERAENTERKANELEQLRERAESAERKANELEHAIQLRAWAEQLLGKYPTNQTSSTPSPLLMLNLKTIPTCTRIDTA